MADQGERPSSRAIETETLEAARAHYGSLAGAKYYAISFIGGFSFRFGPYDGPQAGRILKRCVAEKIPLLITADCGIEFDWRLARDMQGVAAAAKAEHAERDLLSLMLTTARVLRGQIGDQIAARLYGGQELDAEVLAELRLDLAALNDALAPFCGEAAVGPADVPPLNEVAP